ncbi:MAG: hypothetical protein R2911_16205 [Caldilineaceae bacterium]
MRNADRVRGECNAPMRIPRGSHYHGMGASHSGPDLSILMRIFKIITIPIQKATKKKSIKSVKSVDHNKNQLLPEISCFHI